MFSQSSIVFYCLCFVVFIYFEFPCMRFSVVIMKRFEDWLDGNVFKSSFYFIFFFLPKANPTYYLFMLWYKSSTAMNHKRQQRVLKTAGRIISLCRTSASTAQKDSILSQKTISCWGKKHPAPKDSRHLALRHYI